MTKYLINVKPGTSQEKVVKVSADELTVYLRAKPHDGEANEALVKILAKHFGVPKTSITITRGGHSRNKTVEF